MRFGENILFIRDRSAVEKLYGLSAKDLKSSEKKETFHLGGSFLV
jgi:hypothetical protein